jgi:hypothetical protein
VKSLIEPARFAESWGISERTLERYVQRLGIPHKKVRGRVMMIAYRSGEWMTLRLLAETVRKNNPKLTREEVRIHARAIFLEMQNDGGDFDVE